MKLPLLAVLAVLAVPARAADICAPHAALLKIRWFINYERVDGPARSAFLEKSECEITALSGARDFDESGAQAPDSDPEPRMRYWSDASPYELRVELAGGWATIFLVKRDGRYSRVMARIDRVDEKELATNAIDFSGDIADGEFPDLRTGRGMRKIVRDGRLLLTPSKR